MHGAAELSRLDRPDNDEGGRPAVKMEFSHDPGPHEARDLARLQDSQPHDRITPLRRLGPDESALVPQEGSRYYAHRGPETDYSAGESGEGPPDSNQLTRVDRGPAVVSAHRDEPHVRRSVWGRSQSGGSTDQLETAEGVEGRVERSKSDHRDKDEGDELLVEIGGDGLDKSEPGGLADTRKTLNLTSNPTLPPSALTTEKGGDQDDPVYERDVGIETSSRSSSMPVDAVVTEPGGVDGRFAVVEGTISNLARGPEAPDTRDGPMTGEIVKSCRDPRETEVAQPGHADGGALENRLAKEAGESGVLPEPELETAEGENPNSDETAERAAVEGEDAAASKVSALIVLGVPGAKLPEVDSTALEEDASSSVPELDHADDQPSVAVVPDPRGEPLADAVDEETIPTGENAEQEDSAPIEQAVQPEVLEHEEPEAEPAEPQTTLQETELASLEGVATLATELRPWTDIVHVPIRLLDSREVPRSLLEDLVVEVFADVLDGPFFGAGRAFKMVYELVSGPRFTPGGLLGFGPKGFRLQADIAITPGGIVLKPGLDVQLPRPAKAQPQHVRWVEPWWVEASMPCAVAAIPRATIADVTKRRAVDADAVVAFLETRLPKKAPPYAFIWRFPEARLALLGGKPAVGQPSCHNLIGVNPNTHVANVWTAVA